MQRRFRPRRFRGREAGTFFGEPIVDPLEHLSAHYPFPARLNDRYMAKLKTSNHWTAFSKGAVLYEEGEGSTGVYVILEGRAKLSLNSSQGKTLVLGFFGPGTVLGLAAAILERTHAATAEIMRPTKVHFVARKELAREMQENATAARQAAELVSETCYFILSKMRVVDLSQSAGQKLARCLLGLLAHHTDSGRETTAELHLSQETIAQMVGLSRETVTRVLSRFRRKRILDWKRSGLVIRDRRTLEKIADFSDTAAGLCGSALGERVVRPATARLPVRQTEALAASSDNRQKSLNTNTFKL